MGRNSLKEQPLNEFDYAVLTNTWEGVKGGAYNATYEFCREFGWLDPQGLVTGKGQRAIDEYEKESK